MLYIFTEAYAARMGADRNIEFRGQQDNGKVLIHAGNAAAVELQHIDGLRLEKLLEHDAVGDVLPSCDANPGHLATNSRMAQDVIRTGGLFHPPRSKFRQLASARNRL